MTESEYKKEINKMSFWDSDIHRSMEFQINCNRNHSLLEAIDYRKSILNENDYIISSGYLQTGYFKGHDEQTRSACFCMCIEAGFQKDFNKAVKDCSPYEGNESIFQDSTIRDNRQGDLVGYRPFDREKSSNIFSTNGQWGYFDRRIPLQMYEWADNCFHDKPCRIRIEPDQLYSKRPPQPVLECMVMPPQYQWWKKLTIFKGTTKGSTYILLGNDSKNVNDYYDFNRLNIRRLEVSVTRKADDYISMMIEELEENVNPLDPSDKYVIGRMIHLDSNAIIGTNFKDAILNHIDLAYNMYTDDKADIRLGQFLCDGKTESASIRTHIFRLEDIPFCSLFKIANSFFKSKTLVAEWLSNEFTD